MKITYLWSHTYWESLHCVDKVINIFTTFMIFILTTVLKSVNSILHFLVQKHYTVVHSEFVFWNEYSVLNLNSFKLKNSLQYCVLHYLYVYVNGFSDIHVCYVYICNWYIHNSWKIKALSMFPFRIKLPYISLSVPDSSF